MAQPTTISKIKTINTSNNKNQKTLRKGEECGLQNCHIIRFKYPVFNNNNKMTRYKKKQISLVHSKGEK